MSFPAGCCEAECEPGVLRSSSMAGGDELTRGFRCWLRPAHSDPRSRLSTTFLSLVASFDEPIHNASRLPGPRGPRRVYLVPPHPTPDSEGRTPMLILRAAFHKVSNPSRPAPRSTPPNPAPVYLAMPKCAA